MKSIELLKKLGKFPLFTENDVAKIINKGRDYVKTSLYRLHKKGLITRIEKGKYSLYDDPLIFSSYITTPSYFSLWTALRYYNLTQQQPLDLFVISPISRKPIKLKNEKIFFSKTKHVFGYKKERYEDFDIFMAEKEKAIIDSLLFKLPIQDIYYAIKTGELDLEKTVKLANKTKNKSLIKRLSYLLEKKTGKTFNLGPIDNNYILLDYLSKKKGKRNTKWKLIINAEI